MSQLGKLLKAKDPLFTLALKQLEDLTDKPGVDTALVGEILARAYDRAATLGLSPDFNGREIYQSLLNRVEQDNHRLSQLLGASSRSTPEHLIKLIVQKVESLDLTRGGWFLKPAVAKSLLRAQPPSQVMRRLGYKSVETMLSREDIFEVFGALRFIEHPDWLNSFLAQYQKLSFDDFEHRQIKIMAYSSRKWGHLADEFVHKKLHNLTHLKELGVIFVLPAAKLKTKGLILKVLPLLLHYIYEVRLYSTFFKLTGVKANFGEVLVDTLIADTPKINIASGSYIDWRVIQRYYGKLSKEKHPEMFEPHVQPEDLHWRKAEEVLYQLDPELEFWRDMDYVGLIIEDETVTFNLMDMALSYSNNVKYEERYLYHFREALWNEIFMRYMGQKNLEKLVLERLDNEQISPENLKIAKEVVSSKSGHS